MYVIGSLKCFLYSVSILGINIHNGIIVFIHHSVYWNTYLGISISSLFDVYISGIVKRNYSVYSPSSVYWNTKSCLFSINKEKYFIIIIHYKFLSIQTTCTSVE